jgi:hypothetical protein
VWRDQALSVLGRSGLARMLRQVGSRVAQTQPVTADWVAATTTLQTVAEARATWQVWHVRAEAHRRARPAGVAVADLHRAVGSVVDEALSPIRSLPLGAADPTQEPQPLRRSDGTSVYNRRRS